MSQIIRFGMLFFGYHPISRLLLWARRLFYLHYQYRILQGIFIESKLLNFESELIDENLKARQDDPYEKRLQIELFQSNFYPTAIRNYFKLPEDLNEKDFDEMEEKQPLQWLHTWN